MNAQSAEITYKSAPNASLQLDKQTKAVADLAARNGRVDIRGQNSQGFPVKASTEEIPLLLSKAFINDGISFINFRETALEFVKKVKSSVKRGRRE